MSGAVHYSEPVHRVVDTLPNPTLRVGLTTPRRLSLSIHCRLAFHTRSPVELLNREEMSG